MYWARKVDALGSRPSTRKEKKKIRAAGRGEGKRVTRTEGKILDVWKELATLGRKRVSHADPDEKKESRDGGGEDGMPHWKRDWHRLFFDQGKPLALNLEHKKRRPC